MYWPFFLQNSEMNLCELQKGFPGGSAGTESTCNAGDLDSISGLGRSPGEVKGYPLQYSGLENSELYSSWGCKELHTTLTFHFLSLALQVDSLLTEPAGKPEFQIPCL